MKKNKNSLTQPLSEKELVWLENRLVELSKTNTDCMTLETVDGLFCALIVNPIMAKPAEWMNIIFGKDKPFSSDEELEKIMMMLVRYWNHASSAIENKEYAPRRFENVQQWVLGFQQGMDYCREEWDLFLTDAENSSLLSPILDVEKSHETIADEKRNALLEQISTIASTLFYYWIDKINNDKKETKPKIGRNDPCPCGSGKKYKKCCDGQASPTIH